MSRTSGCFGPGAFLDAQGLPLDIGLAVTTLAEASRATENLRRVDRSIPKGAKGLVKSFDTTTQLVRVALTSEDGSLLAEYAASDLMLTSPFPLEGGRVGDGGGAASSERRPHGPSQAGIERARRLRKEMTAAERLLWGELRKLKMNFRRQAPIGSYVADFFHPASKLVVEIDGYFHTLAERQAADLVRTDWLRSQGYRVVRFEEGAVRSRPNEIVKAIVAETAPPPSPTLPPSRGKGDPRYLVR